MKTLRDGDGNRICPRCEEVLGINLGSQRRHDVMAHEAQIPPTSTDSQAPSITMPPLEDLPLAGPIEADYPWDMPMDSLANSLSIIRGELKHIEIGLQAIERAASLREGGWTPPVVRENVKLAAQMTKERESQARYVDSLQPGAKTFVPWSCPRHHAVTRGVVGGNYCPVPSCSEYEGKGV